MVAGAVTLRRARWLRQHASAGRSDLRLGLLGAAAMTAVLLGATIHPREHLAWHELALALAIGVLFVAAGLVVRAAGAGTRLGTVLVLAGCAWFATGFQLASPDWLFTLGLAIENAYLIAIAYLLIAFPAGRLTETYERVLLTLGVLVVSVWQVAYMTVFDPARDFDPPVPENLLLIARHDTAADVIVQSQRAVGFTLSAITVGLLVHRYRISTRPARRITGPVLLAGACFFGTVVLSIANDVSAEPLGEAPNRILTALVAIVPIGVAVGLLRRRLMRGGVASLLVELGAAPAPGELRGALARALGDPSLLVAYPLPDGRHVDHRGQPVELPGEGEGRALTPVERDGERIATLVHDPALLHDPALTASVGAAAALALQNERLQAELRARLDELAASRTRIVEAADAERRRLERNLHDGAQQRLVSIAMALGLAEARIGDDAEAAAPLVREARESLLAALEELRELSRGIHPPVLAERGLAEALGELAYRAPVPVTLDLDVPSGLPEGVETAAYYVASEALANVAKHAQATRVTVRAAGAGGLLVLEVVDDGRGGASPSASGTGLYGLRDRVEALGGRLAIESPVGGGTRLRAELPCG